MAITMARWVEAVRQWLYRWLLDPRRDLVMYRDNDTLKGFVTFRVGLRKMRFAFRSALIQSGGVSNDGHDRLTWFWLVRPDGLGVCGFPHAEIVEDDRMFWVEATTNPFDGTESLEEAFAKLVAALRAKTLAELREEWMADSEFTVAAAERRAAARLLAKSRRDLRYGPQSDGKLTWIDPETGKLVASGGYGAQGDEVHVDFPGLGAVRFTGDTARELHGLGTAGSEGPL